MKRHPVPTIGAWYEELGEAQLFQVVAVDRRERTVEIQQFDGAVREIDLYEEWYSTPIQRAAPPEDLSGVFDIPDLEDSREQDPEADERSWDESQGALDRSVVQCWQDDYYGS